MRKATYLVCIFCILFFNTHLSANGSPVIDIGTHKYFLRLLNMTGDVNSDINYLYHHYKKLDSGDDFKEMVIDVLKNVEYTLDTEQVKGKADDTVIIARTKDQISVSQSTKKDISTIKNSSSAAQLKTLNTAAKKDLEISIAANTAQANLANSDYLAQMLALQKDDHATKIETEELKKKAFKSINSDLHKSTIDAIKQRHQTKKSTQTLKDIYKSSVKGKLYE